MKEAAGHLHKKILSVSLSIGIVLIAAATLLFSIDKAIAAPAVRTGFPAQMQQEWHYVENGKVYYFDNEGKLCYRLLKEAHYRNNPVW